MTDMCADREAAGTPCSRWARRFGRSLRRHPEMAFGFAIIAVLLAMVAVPGAFTARSPIAIDVAKGLQPPSAEHWFGTDDIGRDIYARLVYGARVTLGTVAGALALSALFGGLCGLIAGYFGRWTDLVGGRLVDVVLSFPPIILGVVITGILGTGVGNLMLALSLVYLPVFYRIARSGAIAEAACTYVEAARALGYGEARILFGHVLRNVVPLVLVQYMILFPLALQIQAALGFLGLGVPPPTPDWGAVLEQGKNYLMFAPWISLFPGLFILVSALGVILVGRAVQRMIDTA